MIYVSYGMCKSGSTLAFDLTRAFLEQNGHPQKKLPRAIIKSKFRRNFARPVSVLERDWWQKLMDFSRDDRIIVLKTHSPPPPFIAELIGEGAVKVHAIFRDPRDSSLSLRDAGERARRTGKGSFRRIANLEMAAQRAVSHVSILEMWTSLPGTRLFTYEDVAFDSVQFLKHVADQLDLPWEEDECNGLTERVKASPKRSINRGVPARHRDEFSEEQYKEFSGMFLPCVARSAPQLMNERDRSFLRKMSRREAVCVTKRTYVVVGCPRGGTSVLAGSLSAAGVYMGSFLTNQYEDPQFKVHPTQKSVARDYLEPVIRNRNTYFREWGWKVPNNVYYIREVSDRLINPVYLFVYREIDSIARSSCRHDGRFWLLSRRKLLRAARKHTMLVKEFESEVNGEKHVFLLEDIHRDPAGFAKRFCSNVVPGADIQKVMNFVCPDGGYHAIE